MAELFYHGLSFAGALSILLIALKLLDKIDLSWWWVLSPLWIPTAFSILVFFIIFIIIYFTT